MMNILEKFLNKCNNTDIIVNQIENKTNYITKISKKYNIDEQYLCIYKKDYVLYLEFIKRMLDNIHVYMKNNSYIVYDLELKKSFYIDTISKNVIEYNNSMVFIDSNGNINSKMTGKIDVFDVITLPYYVYIAGFNKDNNELYVINDDMEKPNTIKMSADKNVDGIRFILLNRVPLIQITYRNGVVRVLESYNIKGELIEVKTIDYYGHVEYKGLHVPDF